MVLTLEEKEKLYNKANKLYEEIKNIKIRQETKVNITPKYYDSNSRYANSGFTYYVSERMSIYAENIKDALQELKNFIDFKNGGPEYINGKSVNFVSSYSINALLDFIYYGNDILEIIKRKNENSRKELNDLLN